MAYPTQDPWNGLYYDSSNVTTIGLPETSTPPYPYWASDVVGKRILGYVSDGTTQQVVFNAAIPSRYSWEIDVRIPSQPRQLALNNQSFLRLDFSDDSTRGGCLAISEQGLGVGDAGTDNTLSTLPGTTDLVQAMKNAVHTIRFAVDGVSSRIYIYAGRKGSALSLLFIHPLREGTGADLFRISYAGSSTEPVGFELHGIRLAYSLVIPNVPPIANAGGDRKAYLGAAVLLDGTQSYDPEGADISYKWELTNAPMGSVYTFMGVGSTSDDGDADGWTSVVHANPAELPDWSAPGQILRLQGLPPLRLTGVDHTTGELRVAEDVIPDNLPSTFYHIVRQDFFVQGLSSDPVVSGLPDVQGEYTVQLTVNDGEIDSEPDTVTIDCLPSRVPYGVEPDVGDIWKAIGDEYGLLEGREVFHEAWTAAAQLLSGLLLETWQSHYNYNILDVQSTWQRKWVPIHMFTPDVRGAEAEIRLKFGRIVSEHPIDLGITGLTGTTLTLAYLDSSVLNECEETFLDVVFTGTDSATILQDLNNALPPQFQASLDSRNRLVIHSNDHGIRVVPREVPGAEVLLGLSGGNRVGGTEGSYISERVYRVDDGVDLIALGVQENDLLILNNGQPFRIYRVISGPNGTDPNQRILLHEPIPLDSGSEWEIPSLLRSKSLDFSFEGAYPGDLLRFDLHREHRDTGSLPTTRLRGTVIASYGTTVAADLHELECLQATNMPDIVQEIEFLGLKRRKAAHVPPGTVGIPRLQDTIPMSANPLVWRENIHYTVRPFYRDYGYGAIPMVQFRDASFITPDIEPPDLLWAEYVTLDNNEAIEGRFGRLVGVMREDVENINHTQDTYKSVVSGMLYAQQRGPMLDTMRVGLQILFGQPFSEVNGTVLDIQPYFSPTQGRMIVQDERGEDFIRTYLYRRKESDPSPESGLDINPRTGVPWAVGDRIELFDPIGGGVDIQDYLTHPNWPQTYSGLSSTEVQKFHKFIVRADTELVSFAQLGMVSKFLNLVKPTHKDLIMIASASHKDDIDIREDWLGSMVMRIQDGLSERLFTYDNYRGDGTLWSWYDDGDPSIKGPYTTQWDTIIDGVVDIITFTLTYDHPGGPLTEEAIFPDGPGSPGRDLTPEAGGAPIPTTHGMSLSAGRYVVIIPVKTTGVVPPP